MKNKFRNTSSSIKCGDLILTEQPFAFVLSSKEKGNRCDNCLEKIKLLKCSGCQFVHYCGRLCQKEAWGDHKWECANFKRVAPKVVPDGARMLAKIINRLTRGDGHQVKAFYSANSFRMWKDLMSHYSDLKADKKRMEHFTSLCGVLYEFLKDISLPNTVELMGLYGRMIINSFNILDTDMNSIGTGIYLAASTMDHSCDPNSVATFDGKTLNVRAIKDMPSMDWKQIRISYIDLMKSPLQRQSELLAGYYFECRCDRCMDETHNKYVYAAKCHNNQCDAPINMKWNEKVPKKESESTEKSELLAIENGHEKSDFIDGKSEFLAIENCVVNNMYEGVRCEECGTKYTDQQIDKFVKTMEFTELHLKNMQGASVAYVDVCKYCLSLHNGVLHPLNVLHAQTLDHAFDALIQVQLWDHACEFAEKLIPCFRFYYGEINPLLGLLHLKYGKILLYKIDLNNALIQLKYSEKILKITHGDRHPLYRVQLLPLLQQAIMETA